MNWRLSLLPLILGAGMILVSQSFTFGWVRTGMGAEMVSHVQSTCLFCAGLAIVGLGTIVRHLGTKLATLENEISKLKWSRDQTKLEKISPSVP